MWPYAFMQKNDKKNACYTCFQHIAVFGQNHWVLPYLWVWCLYRCGVMGHGYGVSHFTCGVTCVMPYRPVCIYECYIVIFILLALWAIALPGIYESFFSNYPSRHQLIVETCWKWVHMLHICIATHKMHFLPQVLSLFLSYLPWLHVGPNDICSPLDLGKFFINLYLYI